MSEHRRAESEKLSVVHQYTVLLVFILLVRVPAEVVEFSAGIATQLMGELVENVSTGIDTYSIRQPLGVSAASIQAFYRADWD